MFPLFHVVLTRWDARRCAPGTAGEQAVPKPDTLQVTPGLATDPEVHPTSGSNLVAMLSSANEAGVDAGGIGTEQAYRSRRLVVLPGTLGHCPNKGETDQALDGPAFLRSPHWGRPQEGMSNTLMELSEYHSGRYWHFSAQKSPGHPGRVRGQALFQPRFDDEVSLMGLPSREGPLKKPGTPRVGSLRSGLESFSGHLGSY